MIGLAVALLLSLSSGPARASSDGPSWSWPLGRQVVGTDFDPPETRYGAGHRGIDLPGSPGEPVRAVAAGRVHFSGTVAGVGVVTIDHGGERSTYQPVDRRTVERGDAVDVGAVIGRLGPGGSHCVDACLHLGRLQGERYLDPRERLTGESRFVLVDPDAALPRPPAGALGSLGDLARPVGGPVTSAFGMRVHPVTGIRKLHDGVDFGAACGTPVRAAKAGRVRSAGRDGAYGKRVVLDHGSGVRTAYAHLSSISVSRGERVGVRSVVGRVGTTGMSTGCHLHFMVVRGGRPVDPMG